MELTRNWKTLRNGAFTVLAGLLLLAAPALQQLAGREYRLGSWIGYGLGGLAVLRGAFMIFEGRNRYRIKLSDQTVSLRVPGIDAAVRWSQIAWMGLEQEPNAGKNAPWWLVLVPAEGITLSKPATYLTRDGRNGIQLIDVAELAQGRAGVAGALRHHAGDRYANPTATTTFSYRSTHLDDARA